MPLPRYLNEVKIKFLEPLPQGIPRIVLYACGKQNAQHALDFIYQLFKGDKGSNVAPLYNEKVTDLIFFTQSDRQYKEDFPQYFETNKIYFKPDISGEVVDYHLVNPVPIQERIIKQKQRLLPPPQVIKGQGAEVLGYVKIQTPHDIRLQEEKRRITEYQKFMQQKKN